MYAAPTARANVFAGVRAQGFADYRWSTRGSGTLMLWIEAQSTPVITLLVFGVCYMLAAAIFGLAAILSRRRVAQDLKAVAPVTLTPLGSSWASLWFSSLPEYGRMLIAPASTSARRQAHSEKPYCSRIPCRRRSGRTCDRPSSGICILWSPENGRQWHVGRPPCGQ